MSVRLFCAGLLTAVLCFGCQRQSVPPRASFARSIPWAESGLWLKADTHIHTKFSDGGLPLDQVVRRAYANGCDVLAITDHADSEFAATSDEYYEALAAARRQFPELILFAGLEWNVPPWQGREHATVLVPPGGREQRLLHDFQVQFDDWQRETRDPERALSAVRWLQSQAGERADLPVVFYNHPSRKRSSTQEWLAEFSRLRAEGPVAVGFEGAPGHQDSQPIGGYDQALRTIDRWDPVAAEVGGAWDQMTQHGLMAWGALATSDFHNADPQAADDFWPGEFSETWLYAAERTPQAALAALRAGSFFGGHGQIAREVQLYAFADGLHRPAIAGESLQVPSGAVINVELELTMPMVDWQGRPNLVDEVELIVVTRQDAKVIAHQKPPLSGKALQGVLEITADTLAIRARGRRVVPDGPDLMFYTNPIQFTVASGQSSAGAASAALPPARQMPAWIHVALILGCSLFLILLDRWRIEVGRRFSRDNQLAQPRLITQPHVLQRHMLVALACCVLLGVYGSLVPFHRAQQTWPGAWSQFLAVLQQPLSFSSKTDWATNVILFIPIGFLATGLAMGRVTSDQRRALVPPIVVATCIALSLAIEFCQLWLADRFCSQNDIVAESLGGFLGASAWFIGGRAVAAWLDTFQTYHRPRQRIERMLEVYLLAVFALALLPLDLTLRPAEIYDKWQAGKINLLPLADLHLTWQSAAPAIEEALRLAPVGMLVALWRWPGEHSIRPFRHALLLGLGLLTLIETSQLFVFSRHTSTTHLATGLLGIGAGWALAWWRISSPPANSKADRRMASLSALAIALAYSLLVALVLTLPFDRFCSESEAQQRWATLWSRPLLSVLQAGTIENAVAQALRKVLLFGTAGALAALTIWPFPYRSRGWWQALAAALFLMLCLSIGIEGLQIWLIPHVPDLSDSLLGIAACGLGMAGILTLGTVRGKVHLEAPPNMTARAS